MKLSQHEIRFFADSFSKWPAFIMLAIYPVPTAHAVGVLLARGELFKPFSLLLIGWGLAATLGALWIIHVHITAKRLKGGPQ